MKENLDNNSLIRQCIFDQIYKTLVVKSLGVVNNLYINAKHAITKLLLQNNHQS